MLFVVCCFTCDQWGKNSLPQHPAVRLLSKLRKRIPKDNNFFSKKHAIKRLGISLLWRQASAITAASIMGHGKNGHNRAGWKRTINIMRGYWNK
jgi:hypothetical protein